MKSTREPQTNRNKDVFSELNIIDQAVPQFTKMDTGWYFATGEKLKVTFFPSTKSIMRQLPLLNSFPLQSRGKLRPQSKFEVLVSIK